MVKNMNDGIKNKVNGNYNVPNQLELTMKYIQQKLCNIKFHMQCSCSCLCPISCRTFITKINAYHVCFPIWYSLFN